jgi:SAM-dependent methyltransferase
MGNPLVRLAHRALENGICYDFFQSAVGATKTRSFLIDAIAVWENPKHVVDLGCGTGFCITKLTYTDTYLGIDYSTKYLDIAKRIPTPMQTQFLQADLGDPFWSLGIEFTEPQVVMAMGLFHHLSDPQMSNLFGALRELLPVGSSLVSIDPVITSSTSRIGRWVASNDRGKFIRSPEELKSIAGRVGFACELRVFQNQIRIPADTLVGVMRIP